MRDAAPSGLKDVKCFREAKEDGTSDGTNPLGRTDRGDESAGATSVAADANYVETARRKCSDRYAGSRS